MNDTFFNEISDDDLIIDRFEIFETDNGFMSYDNKENDYLHDKKGNNCFDDYWQAAAVIDDAIIAIKKT